MVLRLRQRPGPGIVCSQEWLLQAAILLPRPRGHHATWRLSSWRLYRWPHIHLITPWQGFVQDTAHRDHKTLGQVHPNIVLPTTRFRACWRAHRACWSPATRHLTSFCASPSHANTQPNGSGGVLYPGPGLPIICPQTTKLKFCPNFVPSCT